MNKSQFNSTSISDFNQFFIKNRDQWSSVFILVDTNTHQFCLPFFLQNFVLDEKIEILEVDAGEAAKDIEIAAGLWMSLSELNADRKSLIINLGGGVICDLGGWVAANYKRGIDFIHIPTSLLAMIDASIGGKTGIDFAGVKNLIGSFTNPNWIINEPSFLNTLAQEEWSSGYAEMVKHALVASEVLWDSISKITPEKHDKIIELIDETKQIKIDIVAKDYKESGVRKVLNFGHTFGHAIEAIAIERSEVLSHGHSIALGMVLANRISFEKGLLAKEKKEEINNYLLSIYSMVPWLAEEKEKIFYKMSKDKKNDGNSILMVLLRDISDVVIDINISADEVESVLTSSSN